ncbi:hypothetical protein Htur_1968 [Haloterrigena turkmenica DSM 5511]|uniref:Uncharacterized protein n=1 Tax=Haloterrigena turkmenica (strain ATCC 51198 / DSM 5511 / JCM 9101 / NCIMB 13204 / VKM B-1734 / 4k) TaxID=543526 RepID=D2RSS6_HALTV|nr:hypothetical protein [Haloterrigena turkmenica]ADB60852.1 hypothetical protein Htur_1968 [Haloterrigena turkmenica DSM 5511]
MRFATLARFDRVDWGESTAAIVAMGLVLAVAGIVRTLETPVSQPVVAFELFVSLLVPTGLATGGYWLASRNVSSDLRWRAVTRVSIGIVVACGLAAWLTVYVALEGGAVRDPLSLTTTLAAVGGATGFATAVREPLGVATPDSLGSSVPAHTAETESPATAESADATARSSTAGADASPEPTIERPTAAAAATVTTALGSTPTDIVPASDRSTDGATADSDASTIAGTAADSEVSKTTSTPTPSESEAGASPAIWDDSSPEGRTAAPARPVEPPEPTAGDDSGSETFEIPGRDAFDDGADSPDPLESPTPRRDPGVGAVAAVPLTAETVLDVLRNERVRLALAVLYHEWDGQARSVDALARAVSSHTDDSADAVAAGLKHATLPRLAEIRAVDWDPYADRVSAPDHAVFEEGVREASALLESFEPGTR